MNYSWLAFYLALISFVILSGILIDLLIGIQSIKQLSKLPLQSVAQVRVSIIVAARNEEEKIQAGLTSLLNQNHSDFEVILVNDRSTDSTGNIARSIGEKFLNLKVLDVAHLPENWLGKNHALYLGATHASGDLLLFTDADIVMHPDTLTRATAYLVQNSIDHLALTPEMRVPGALLNIAVGGFTIFFSIFARPWKASDPRSGKHIGIGAFNLIRKVVYERIGTHQAIALRPDDDLKLGKLVKKSGYRQELLSGAGLLWVEWYASVRQMIDGLMKNSFSGLEYRLWLVPMATVAQFFLFVWPFFGAFLTVGGTRWLNLLMCLLLVFVCAYHATLFRARPVYALGIPVASVIIIYIIWKSALSTIVNGGIRWRGTYYSLAKLRANKV